METDIIIQKITTLQKARTLLIGIDAEKWIINRRTDHKGNCCFLGHLDRQIYGVATNDGLVCASYKFTNDLQDIGYEIFANGKSFDMINNGHHPDYQQPIIKDRGIAALDYCINVLSKQLEASRVNAYDELITKDNTEEVSDLITINKAEYENRIID